jgi:uncharacterized ubiquitin-like protein YukD
MIIILNIYNAKKITINVDENNTIEELRDIIFNSEGIKVDSNLYYKGISLCDEKKILSDYKMQESDVLFLGWHNGT